MKYYVIAGTKQEFDSYILSKSMLMFAAGETSISLTHFVYVSSPDTLRGIEDPRGWFIGSYKQRKDIRDIIHAIMIAQRGIVMTDEFVQLTRELGV